MKKVCALVLFIIVGLTLFACSEATQARATVSDGTVVLTGSSVTFKVSLKDPNSEIKDSEINFNLVGTGFNETQTFDFFKNTKELVFEGLNPATEYTLKVTAVSSNKSLSLLTKIFKTLDVGLSEEAPILIGTVEEFLAITDPKLHYKQTANLDFNGASIAPLFNASKRFEGSYNGDGFTISNINMNDSEHVKTGYLSIFGYIRSGSLKNIVLENITIDNTANPDNSTLYAGILASRIDDESAVISNITIKNSFLILRHNYRLNDSGNWVNTATRRSLFAGSIVGSTQGEISNIIVENTVMTINIANLYPGVTSSAGTYIGGAIGLIEADKGTKFENLDIHVNMNIDIDSNTNPQISVLSVGGVIGAHRGQKGITGMISSGSIRLNIVLPTDAEDSLTSVGGLIGLMVTVQNITDAVSFVNIDVQSNATSTRTTLRVGSLIGRSEQTGQRIVRLLSVDQSVKVSTPSMSETLVNHINFERPTTNYNLKYVNSTLEFNGSTVTSEFDQITKEEITTFIQNQWVLERLAIHLG